MIMQEPIISPWLIYLANIPQTLTFALVVTVFACAVIVVAAVFFRYMAKDEAKTLKDSAYRYAYQGAEKEMMAEARAEAHGSQGAEDERCVEGVSGMEEYITKEQAIAAMEQVTQPECLIKDTPKDFAKIIEKLPAADIAPVVHAQWVITDEANVCKPLSDVNVKTRNYLEHDCECSNCGFICGIGVGQIKQAKYCPGCGARMDGEE